MKKLELSGVIENSYSDNFQSIKLVQQDGYKIDLVGRFKELMESFSELKVQVGYYISLHPCTKDEMLEGFLKILMGAVDASFESNEYNYSSMTYGVDYDTNLKIGGHDLFQELKGQHGKFLIIEISFEQ